MKMWTKSGRKRFVPTTKHTSKINVWAAFSSIGTFPLCIFATNMDSSLFLDILIYQKYFRDLHKAPISILLRICSVGLSKN